jgi:1-acyl-sn-glycerol-3-phosphate acyltransferase
MTRIQRLAIAVVRGLLRLLCRIDDAQLARVPAQGPLIIAVNHVNILEIPILFTHLQPRPVTGFVAAVRWDNPVTRWLLTLTRALPLRRGEADLAALRRGVASLKAGQLLVIAPEGTRSGHGSLQKAHPGLVLLALHSGAPVLPLVYYGHEPYKQRWVRLRRTDFHIVVGEPFYLDAGGVKVTRRVRRQMVDEVMAQMAALLPPAYRGVYADLEAATETYLAFGSQ